MFWHLPHNFPQGRGLKLVFVIPKMPNQLFTDLWSFSSDKKNPLSNDKGFQVSGGTNFIE
jgi:hypothetical protein